MKHMNASNESREKLLFFYEGEAGPCFRPCFRFSLNTSFASVDCVEATAPAEMHLAPMESLFIQLSISWLTPHYACCFKTRCIFKRATF
jgi:hypothetical protein